MSESPAQLRVRANRGAAWVGATSFVLGISDLLSTIVILQLWVSREEFGIATLASALLPLVDRIGGMGMASVLVRERDPDAGAQSTIYWLGVGIAVTAALLLGAARVVAGAVQADPIVASLVAAFGVRCIAASVSAVPDSMMRRELRYAELATVRMIASAVDTATKIGLAYLGAHGVPALRVWCFVAGPIANAIVTTIGVQLRQPFRPHFVFHRDVAARALRFWVSVSGGELLYYAYTSADYVVVGACFGRDAVGAYRLAYELVLDVVRLVSMVTAEVAYPTFAKLAREPAALARQVIAFARQNLVVLAPVLAFVAIEADDVLALLFPPCRRPPPRRHGSCARSARCARSASCSCRSWPRSVGRRACSSTTRSPRSYCRARS
jgi:O-antigen/teichoic acid export membrane protein